MPTPRTRSGRSCASDADVGRGPGPSESPDRVTPGIGRPRGATERGPAGPRGRLWSGSALAARRRLGRGQRGRRAGDAEHGRRRRRHLHRHRRRVRRRAQRAAHRPVPARARRRRASPSRPRWAGGCRRCRRTTPWTNFRAWNDRSRANLGVDTLDLVQLHCPPTPVYSDRRGLRRARHPGRGEADRRVRRQRRDLRRGAHRDRPARTWPACRSSSTRSGSSRWSGCCRRRPRPGWHHRPGPARQRPAVRPLRRDTTFGADDHRNYNRHGEAFDVGETFSGVRLRDRPGGGGAARAAGAGRAARWRSSRCAGSSTSPASPWSSPAPATPSRPRATPPRPRSPAGAAAHAAVRGGLRRADPPPGPRPLVGRSFYHAARPRGDPIGMVGTEITRTCCPAGPPTEGRPVKVAHLVTSFAADPGPCDGPGTSSSTSPPSPDVGDRAGRRGAARRATAGTSTGCAASGCRWSRWDWPRGTRVRWGAQPGCCASTASTWCTRTCGPRTPSGR